MENWTSGSEETRGTIAAFVSVAVAWVRRKALIDLVQSFGVWLVAFAFKVKGGQAMLEGKEVEKKFGEGKGELYVDVSMDGTVKFGVSYEDSPVKGVKVKTANEAEIGLADLIHLAADKTGNGILKAVAEAVDKAVIAGAKLGGEKAA